MTPLSQPTLPLTAEDIDWFEDRAIPDLRERLRPAVLYAELFEATLPELATQARAALTLQASVDERDTLLDDVADHMPSIGALQEAGLYDLADAIAKVWSYRHPALLTQPEASE